MIRIGTSHNLSRAFRFPNTTRRSSEGLHVGQKAQSPDVALRLVFAVLKAFAQMRFFIFASFIA